MRMMMLLWLLWNVLYVHGPLIFTDTNYENVNFTFLAFPWLLSIEQTECSSSQNGWNFFPHFNIGSTTAYIVGLLDSRHQIARWDLLSAFCHPFGNLRTDLKALAYLTEQKSYICWAGFPSCCSDVEVYSSLCQYAVTSLIGVVKGATKHTTTFYTDASGCQW